MRIHVAQGELTLMADHETDEEFLVSIATTFAEGGALMTCPADSKGDTIALEPAKPVRGQ